MKLNKGKFRELVRELMVGYDTNAEMKDDWIKRQLGKLPSGATLLDAGAGELRWKPFCRHLNYVSLDLCQYDGTESEVGLQNPDCKYPHIDIVSDIMDMPVEDDSFDAILCSEVLEHVSNPNAALKEIVRVTKPGGY